MAAAMEADLVVISGAKIYGPRRVGALIGDLHSSADERAHDLFGSPDAPAAMALAFASQLRARESDDDEARIQLMRDGLEARLVASVPGLVINGVGARRLAGSLHISSPHIPGDAVVSRLWGKLAVSTGAACQSGAQTPSHVLTAMGLDEWVRNGAVRIGIGRFNNEDEIERAGELLVPALNAQTLARRVA
jgi:cysteine desulfurase